MMSRAFKIFGNWKMNHSVAELRAFLSVVEGARSQWAPELFLSGSLEIGILPQSPLIERASNEVRSLKLPITIGAQNAHGSLSGAFTGETSANVLKDLGAPFSLVAHSERRQYYGETDESAAKRAEGLLSQGVRVLYCIGETREERERGETNSVLERQLRVLSNTPERKTLISKAISDDRFLIAYEPVWAIGTGLTPSPEEAEEAHRKVKSSLKSSLGLHSADRLFVLYGGSATPENASGFLAMGSIDGLLVGGASLDASKFLKLIAAAQSLLPSA